MMRELMVVTLVGVGGTLVMAQTDTTAPKPRLPAGRTLSEKLDRSNGVVTPPANIDPKIEKPAPDPHPNSTRVIPPPGAPGGRRDIQPK